MEKYDFSGWATKNNLKCSDGRVIRKDAFKHCDGVKVPLCWNHDHDDPYRIVGHALLENREEGVYAYCSLNETDLGKTAREYIAHGDIQYLSIYANQLKQQGENVLHGAIREVSLVLAGANPGAYIDSIMVHGEESDEEAIIYTGESFELYHSEANKEPEKKEENKEEESEKSEKKEEESDEEEFNVLEEYKKFSDKQKDVVHAMVGLIIEDMDKKESEGGKEEMKHNAFDREDVTKDDVLSHADQETIISMAKQSNIGSIQNAIRVFSEENDTELKHGFSEEDLQNYLFPQFKDLKPGAPELIERDQSWVSEVMRKTHKSPISRIRTRQVDAREASIRAKGYAKGTEKKLSGNPSLINRTTDPQTVYRKDSLNRDDIIDITDFDVVAYQYGIMRNNLLEDIALATMVGDLREDGDPDKIKEEHIRPIWKDDELYTIHKDVDIAAAKAELQGTETGAHFGDNYVYAEAIVTASLYSREEYKGSGNLEFYCTPHLLNVMLLARDLNGRRIYDSKADLAKALNVTAIHSAEQFEGLERTTADGNKKKLLGLFVNLSDYNHGSTKGGEITRFEQFDIDFNQNKYLIETRLSGALTRVKSAIALEEPVVAG